MTQVSRISCVECRRRKIKCNKLNPCNQCIKRDIMCDYPKKFRRIDIDRLDHMVMEEGSGDAGEYDSEDTGEYASSSGQKTSPHSLQVMLSGPADRDERLVLLRKIKDLEKVIHSLDQNSHDVNDPTINCYQGKYYGPTSAISMLSDFASTLGPKAFIFEKNPNFRAGGRKLEVRNFDTPSKNNTSISSLKKLIPNFHFDKQENRQIIGRLVQRFFQFDCSIFFDQQHVMNLVTEQLIRTDEEFMVVLMILLTAINRGGSDALEDPCGADELREYEKFIPSLISDFNVLKKKSLLSVSVIMAELLLFEFYFYTLRLEIAWATLFNIISSCYSLGLHIFTDDSRRMSVWWAVNFYESLLCLMLGRPNPVSAELLAYHSKQVGASDRLRWRVDITMLGKESNALLLHSMQEVDYAKVQALSARYDEAILHVKAYVAAKPQDWLRRTDLVLLLTNQAKLHQPFMRKQTESKARIFPLVADCIDQVKAILSSRAAAFSNKHFRSICPFGDCYFFQSLAVLFTYLSYTKCVTPDVLQFQKELNYVVHELGEKWMHKIVYIALVVNESITNNLNEEYFSKANEQPHLVPWYNVNYNDQFFLQLPETARLFGEMDEKVVSYVTDSICDQSVGTWATPSGFGSRHSMKPTAAVPPNQAGNDTSTSIPPVSY
ncbi:hypothetical protein BABINDRAFT_165638 [Babjeviella inositovora NRRL Y-12698]|uniref:Zn(2)-C6 fungal-type domain-containing protein n=1 Tax=Babjeviella inositovora NRRL Y-12698 TaxID=984486 RepID=A0A1E3QWX8_9ASCO|nr:uncharacterized protein BABINDRAFT_165638 [Babjeviella inositovora NRRL Y-12698]ODQ82150.1 hypothetical protein BABINDRAFT_165638 [Babjeviella inositovora NRRL Y-12698]